MQRVLVVDRNKQPLMPWHPARSRQLLNAGKAAVFRRFQSLRVEYADVKPDFADCAIIALAERLDIQRVATLDRRDFSRVRPVHCAFLTLYPQPMESVMR